MKYIIIWVYRYFTWKPESGLVCGGAGYLLALKTIALTDHTLKVVAAISAVATCLISCITLLSLLIKCILWCRKTAGELMVKLKK